MTLFFVITQHDWVIQYFSLILATGQPPDFSCCFLFVMFPKPVKPELFAEQGINERAGKPCDKR